MRVRRFLDERCANPLLRWRLPGSAAFAALIVAFFASLLIPALHARQKEKLPRPRRLDEDITLHRDPATGELNPTAGSASGAAGNDANATRPIAVVTQVVPVMCNVLGADGAAVRGLQRKDFRVFDDGVEQPVTYFDASTESASVALVLDASPSVLRDSEEMKNAARALVDALSSSDQTAVVDFSAHTYLQLPFSGDGGLIRKAVARVDARSLLGDTGGSNIYEAVFLTAREVFAGRTGRKAIVLLTDGQDSQLGLTLDPVTAGPRLGWPADRLTFEDVERTLATADIQVFVVSTESRPKIMTPDWVVSHASQTLVTPSLRGSGIPAYTLYLAELARRSGGQLYFLREAETLADTFRQIALKIRAEYTLGFSPAANASASPRSGWHQLRVEVIDRGDPTVVHRNSYYVPAAR
ncbi:MAG TPA: VWA domain-containing protein [Candidatus Acidoferrales bacterium]|jgi:Ca-activated chloride channel family protein|nr:VWA domain-containing protein [Candidatus Acidoferrales bacterium]